MLEQNKNERSVILGEVPHDQAVGQLRDMADKAFEGLEDAVPSFQKVTNFTTFTAEYAWIGDDLVYHFFLPPERSLATAKQYWERIFPTVLDVRARDYFSADYPRLVAKYTEEMASWWMRARGYGHVIDTDALAIRFLKDLDQALDTLDQSPPTA